MPRLNLMALRKPCTQMWLTAAHAISVRTTMLILVLFVEFPTFSNHKITHNASYFSKMSWKGDAIPTANLAKISES